jgi:CDP-diacylglycerol--serine O-phosphatidyltransferase
MGPAPQATQGARHFTLLRSFHLADFFTLANGSCGTAAIFFAMAHMREAMALRVYAAGGAHRARARVRRGRRPRGPGGRHHASPLGRELDSLADVISFGVAPACLAYAAGMNAILDQLVLLYFVACGISRLARYNITAEAMSVETGKVTYFEGTPIPTSVLLVAVLMGLAGAGRIGDALPFGSISVMGAGLHPVVLLFALSGTLMVSKTLRIPKP